MYHILLIHSSVDGHLHYFHFLAIIHNAAMNMYLHILCGPVFSFLFGYILRSGISRS